MSIKDDYIVTGKIHLLLVDANGNIKDERSINNLVVNAGLAFITSRILGTASTIMGYMAVGLGGATTELPAQTALTSELSRVALTSAQAATTTATNDSVQYVGVFPAAGVAGAINEAGIFNATPTGGTMFARKTFGVVTKALADTLTITWVITAA